MTGAEREVFTQAAWQRLIAQVEDAMRQKVFDARTDRWLAWGPLDLDRQGWDELMEEMERTHRGIKAIGREARLRLEASGETPMRANYGLLGFESPRRRSGRRRKPDGRGRP